MLLIPSTFNGTELGVQEWGDSLFICYGIKTPDFPSHCDSCGVAFSTFYALYCKKGGFVTAFHNELCDGVSNLAEEAFTLAHVRDDPKIFTGHAMRGGVKVKEKLKVTGAPSPEEGEEKGDLLIWDLWTQGTDSIHDMRFMNTDTFSYQSKTPEKCLESAQRKKKKT